MKSLVTLMMLVAVVVMAAPGVGMADPFTENVEADAWLAASSPHGNNNGVAFRVGWASNDANRGILRFDLSDYATITSAKLWVCTTGSMTERTISVHLVTDDSWGESTVTWDNQPSHNAVATDTQTFGTTASAYCGDWDVTSIAQSSLADDKLSILLRNPTESDASGSMEFWTKERISGTYTPYLEIEGTVPEPATMTLILLGLPLVLRRCKK